MKKFTHKQIIWTGLTIIFLLIIVSAFLSYNTSLRDPITVTFKRFYPAAFIGSQVVSINDIEQAQIVAARYGVAKADAAQMVLNDTKADILVGDLNLSIPRDAAADEMRFYTKGNESQYRDLLKRDFDGSEHFFYKYVIRSQVNDAYLRMKYYSEIAQSNTEYKRAQDVIERISKGEKFEDLAKSESADQVTGQIGGDLGFYESGQLLPELDDQVTVSAIGEIRKDVIISRLGYHILYPVEFSNVDGKKLWHVKHILFAPHGYDLWLEDQINSMKVKTLKNI